MLRLLPFQRSADFAFDKAAGEPCRHLEDDHLCGIDARLVDSGMRGCVAYDCFGAGQTVTQDGRVERSCWWSRSTRSRGTSPRPADRGADVAELLDEAERVARAVVSVDEVDALRARVAPVLRAVADAARASYDGRRRSP